MNKLIKIEKENINLAWNHAAPYLEKSLKFTPEYTLLDVFRLIKTGHLTLWMFYNEKKKKAFGAMATEAVEHPQKRILVIFLMSADDFVQVEPLFQDLVLYARQIGADGIECYGRFGLQKLLANLGFKKSYIAMNYDVN